MNYSPYRALPSCRRCWLYTGMSPLHVVIKMACITHGNSNPSRTLYKCKPKLFYTFFQQPNRTLVNPFLSKQGIGVHTGKATTCRSHLSHIILGSCMWCVPCHCLVSASVTLVTLSWKPGQLYVMCAMPLSSECLSHLSHIILETRAAVCDVCHATV